MGNKRIYASYSRPYIRHVAVYSGIEEAGGGDFIRVRLLETA